MEARAWPRPDGTWVLRLPDEVGVWKPILASRPAEVDPIAVHVSADDDAAAGALRAAALAPARREHEWRIPLPAARIPVITSQRHRLVSVVGCDLERVLRLDDAIRDVIPGTQHWRGSIADLEESLRDDEFDPELYRIAVRDDGSYDGLIRVWWRTPAPRLGCVGVTAVWRRTRLPAMLMGDALRRLRARGVEAIVTETDETNRGSHSLAARLGGAPERIVVEWRSRAPHLP